MALKEINAAWVQEQWDKGSQARSVVDFEIWQNLAFIYDEHYAVYQPASRRFTRPDPNDGRVRLTINHIKSIWRGELARLIKARPIPEVIAPSDSDTDRNAAKVANRLLNSELERLDFEQIRNDLLVWVTSAGHAYIHTYWDPEARNGEGDTCMEVVLPQELVRDPAVRRDLEEGLWVIHGRVVTVEQAYEMFDEEFKASDNVSALNLASMTNHFGGGSTDTNQGVLVLRLWHKPCKRYPEGLVLTVVDDKEVERKPYPFEHGELPFVDFHHIRLPGRFEGQSVIRPLWGPQKDLNQARSRAAELRGLLTSPKILAPEGSLAVDRIGHTPGEVIEFRQTGMFEPKPMQIGTPPQFLFNEAQAAFAEMQDIARQREVSRGGVPSSGLPAAAIAMLQESDDTALAPVSASLERGVARLGKQILSIIQQHWVTERAVRVMSEEGTYYMTQRFKGSDVVNELDVQVVPGSALPRNKAQQRQDFMALWDRGLVQDPRLLVRYMELPNSDGIMRKLDHRAKHAQREHDRIYKFVMGESQDDVSSLVAESWHDHAIHKEEHNEFRMSEEFESWPPLAKALLDEHVHQHDDLEMLQMQEQVAKQMMLAPPPVPGQEQAPPAGAPQNTIPGINAPEEGPDVAA